VQLLTEITENCSLASMIQIWDHISKIWFGLVLVFYSLKFLCCQRQRYVHL